MQIEIVEQTKKTPSIVTIIGFQLLWNECLTPHYCVCLKNGVKCVNLNFKSSNYSNTSKTIFENDYKIDFFNQTF